MRYFKDQRGEVSLFVVIFATLLITIVTVAFIRIMVQGQQQATATDLSQSAYDSSLAGVEDAKRAIIEYQKQGSVDNIINSVHCNEAINKLLNGKPAGDYSQVQVQASASDNKFNQAYTCVTVTMNTDNVSGKLEKDESKVIYLNSGSDVFDTVKIEWFTQADAGSTVVKPLVSGLAQTPLFAQDDWLTNSPPILRSQLMQFTNGSFKLTDLDSSGDANTLFLYPTDSASAVSADFSHDVRQTQPTGAMMPISCKTSLAAGGYACTAKLKLPLPINGAASNRAAYLRLTSLYNKTNFKVTLLDTNSGVDKTVTFKGVQPIVDSTGRADDLFRRVRARVELNTDFPYPDGEISVTNNFCKDFIITNISDDYHNYCTE